MLKNTDIHLLQQLEAAMPDGLSEHVYGGVAGRDENGNFIVPQVLFRRTSLDSANALDGPPNPNYILYTVHILAAGYGEVGDIEDRLLNQLASDRRINNIEGGFDGGEIGDDVNQRVYNIRVKVV